MKNKKKVLNEFYRLLGVKPVIKENEMNESQANIQITRQYQDERADENGDILYDVNYQIKINNRIIEIEGTLNPYHTGRSDEYEFEPGVFNDAVSEKYYDENWETIESEILNKLDDIQYEDSINEDSYIDDEGNLQGLDKPKLDDVKISIIDVDKLNSKIDDSIKKMAVDSSGDLVNQSGQYRVRSSVLGLIHLPKTDKMGGEFAVLDDELVGNYAENGGVKFAIYLDTYDEEGELSGLGIMPKYNITATLSDLSDLIIGEKTIKDFMGRRYKYNPRIERNMYNLANILGVKF